MEKLEQSRLILNLIKLQKHYTYLLPLIYNEEDEKISIKINLVISKLKEEIEFETNYLLNGKEEM